MLGKEDKMRREEGMSHCSESVLLPFGAGKKWKGQGRWLPAASVNTGKARRSTAGHLCVPAAQDWATHPLTDVSTSCISGTVSVRMLSCRDSERSTLPLRGRVSEGW